MPVLDGIEVAGQIADSRVCIVFTTAHAEHVVKARELQVVDYLLKPISASRLREALDRVHSWLA
jgi:DNA-binding LytR/AlgR family response regulator